MTIRKLVIVAMMAGGISAAAAQSPMHRSPGTPIATPNFVTASAQSDEFEIREGKMAERMGSPAVRRFGARMVRDHTKTTMALKRAIRRSGMAPPPPPPLRPDQRRMVERLQNLSRAGFDKAYIRQQVQSHRRALALEAGYARSGGAPAIRAAARAAVPIVKMHLRMAERMASR